MLRITLIVRSSKVNKYNPRGDVLISGYVGDNKVTYPVVDYKGEVYPLEYVTWISPRHYNFEQWEAIKAAIKDDPSYYIEETKKYKRDYALYLKMKEQNANTPVSS